MDARNPGRSYAVMWLLFSTLFFAFQTVLAFASSPLNVRSSSGSGTLPIISSRASRTSDVQFDNYSLIIRGQRVILYSGEFHTFRLPVPSLWPDILQKVKAAGFNGISVYTHMGLINPSRGVVDFNGFRALQPLFDAAKESGIWIILRPVADAFIQYINAETTAGGIAHWITTEVAGEPRSNASDYEAAWQDYIKGIIDVTAPNQISSGGPVIAVQVDNEFSQSPDTHAQYFVQLEDVYHASAIDVPLTYNDPGMGSNFINGTRYDCTHQTWQQVATNYYSYHAQVDPLQPQFLPEFQSGAPDSWGLTSPGYEGCRLLTGPDFLSVFNLNLWAANAKLVNFYMFYGLFIPKQKVVIMLTRNFSGTSWGALPYPGIYTSYDYGGTIAENRVLTSKFDEMKRQGMSLRSSPEFYKTDWVADTNTGLSVSTNSASYVTELRNPDTGSGFYIVRQANSTSTATIDFKLNATTSLGAVQIPLIAPAITIGGRQSKVIVTDYSFGSKSKALYSTAQIFFAGVIDGRDVLFIYGNSTQAHEIALGLTGTSSGSKVKSPFVNMAAQHSGLPQAAVSSTTVVTFSPGTNGLTTVWDSGTQLILFADTQTAATFWSPTIAAPSSSQFKNYWAIGTNESILVGGPFLVRNATISGSTLALRGDLELANGTSAAANGVQLSVIAPHAIKTITWNGAKVTLNATASSSLTSHGGFVGHIQPKTSFAQIQKAIPDLNKTGWKYKDSLPEVNEEGFDDSGWVLANRTTTNIYGGAYFGDGRLLFGCDYGFCENTVIWRGHFKATGLEKSVNLSVNGGEGFAASVWLNDVYLNTYGNTLAAEFNETFVFPPGAVKKGKDNVITVVQDNMGLDENGYN
ncbi:LOW QUALITY PROTEIN: hypothetical protein CVT26_002820, partial [Gymnopilus dilepis]